MRVVVLAVLAGLAACSPSAPKTEGEAAPADATSIADAPRPKTGKWTMTMDVPGMPQKQSLSICLTPEMIAEMNDYAKASGQTNCAETKVSREGGAYVTRAKCESGGVTSTVESRASGDFNSRYSVETTVVTGEGASATTMKTSTVAEYAGAC